MKYSFTILVLLIASIFLSACSNDENYLTLSKSKIKRGYLVDTIESYPDRNMLLIGVQINHALGKFEYYPAVVKRHGKTEIIYKIEMQGYGGRISKDYIAKVRQYGETNWGWFKTDSGKIQTDLPAINNIIDSLKSAYSQDFFIGETNGFINIRLKGKTVKSLNYGDFVTKYKSRNFDSLKYKLYKLQGDSLIIISNDGNDLFNQQSGVYFIPLPGYGVKAKFYKREIFDLVDSVSKLSSTPDKLRIKSVQ